MSKCSVDIISALALPLWIKLCSLSWRKVSPSNQEHVNQLFRMHLLASMDYGQLVSCLLSGQEGPYFHHDALNITLRSWQGCLFLLQKWNPSYTVLILGHLWYQ